MISFRDNKQVGKQHDLLECGSPVFYCSICNVISGCKEEWISYISDKLRRKNELSSNIKSCSVFESLNARIESLLAEQGKFVIRDNTEEEYQLFTCILCDTKLKSYFALAEHTAQSSHKVRVKNYYAMNEHKNNVKTNAISGDVTLNEVPQNKVECIEENLVNSIKYLREFCDGQLRCIICQQLFPLQLSLAEHLTTCVCNSPQILDNFRNYNKLTNSDIQVLTNEVSQCKKSKSNFIRLQRNVLTQIAVHTFICFRCNISSSVQEWKTHLRRQHLTTTTNGIDVVHVICVLCYTILFGTRKQVCQHTHFNGAFGNYCALLAAYPHVNVTLPLNKNLPKYYKFLNKMTSDFKAPSSKIAFYCLACDYYDMEKPKKHFQNNEHKFKIQPTFEFRYCSSCYILFYSDSLLFNDHKYSLLHEIGLSKTPNGAFAINAISEKHRNLVTCMPKVINGSVYQPKNPFQKFVFWCDPCVFHTSSQIEWRGHLSNETHIQKNNEGFEHTCCVCKMDIFGSGQEHAAHSASLVHKRIKDKLFRKYNEWQMKNSGKSLWSSEVQSYSESSSDENDEEKVVTASRTTCKISTPKIDICDMTFDPYLQVFNGNLTAAQTEKILHQFMFKVENKHGSVKKLKNYFCWFCDRYFSSERSWWRHLKTADHIIYLKSYFKESNISEVSAVLCYTCLTLTIGSSTTRSLHVKTMGHRKACANLKPVLSIMKNDVTTIDVEDISINEIETSSQIDCYINSDNTKRKELTEEPEDEKDELYEMLVKEDSDPEESATSEDEVDKAVINVLKNNFDTIVQDKERPKNEADIKENVENSVVIRGIPSPVLKNRKLMQQTFCNYVQFERSFTKKSEPGSLYLVVTKELEESFNVLKRNLNKLKTKFGTDEINIDYTTKKNDQSAMRDQVTEKVTSLYSNLSELKNGIIYFIRRYELETRSVESKRRIQQLQESIKKLAENCFPDDFDIKTHIFGSRVTGLASENSDVDIYLQIGPTFCGQIHNKSEIQQQLVVLFAELMKDYPSFSNIISIPFARVPIVKFTHVASNLNCDLSFKSGLSTMNSILVRKYLELDKRVKYVVCGVKLWMKLNDLADRNLFTTYAQIWMVLFFLMQPNIAVVPTVLKFNSMAAVQLPDLSIEEWSCAFPEKHVQWVSPCILTENELLRQFFVFYSNLALVNYVLCTLTGLLVEKKHFLKYYEDLPMPFKTFKLKMAFDPLLCRRVINDFEGFCVQDPFDHCHNLTKTINCHKFTCFVKLCSQTYALFK